MQLDGRPFFLLLSAATLLVIVGVLVDVVQPASIYAPDFNDSSDHFLDQQRSCRDLCSFCPTCNGFYCGEECICECSQDPVEHAKCIDQIKANSDKLGLVYDLFIQLPQRRSSRARFGRRAMTPDDKVDPARMGFHKILFSNFATKQRSTTPEQLQDSGPEVTQEKYVIPTDHTVSKDPLENLEVVDLLFGNGT